MNLYRYWMMVDHWPYEAAACLINDVDPDEKIPDKKKEAVENTLRLLRLSSWGEYYEPAGDKTIPRITVLQWAWNKEIELPRKLNEEWFYSTVDHEVLEPNVLKTFSDDLKISGSIGKTENFYDYWLKADV